MTKVLKLALIPLSFFFFVQKLDASSHSMGISSSWVHCAFAQGSQFVRHPARQLWDWAFALQVKRLSHPVFRASAAQSRALHLAYFARTSLIDPRLTQAELTGIAIANAELFWAAIWNLEGDRPEKNANRLLLETIKGATQETILQMVESARKYILQTPTARFTDRTVHILLDLIVESMAAKNIYPSEALEFLSALPIEFLAYLARAGNLATQAGASRPVTLFDRELYFGRPLYRNRFRAEKISELYAHRLANERFANPRSLEDLQNSIRVIDGWGVLRFVGDQKGDKGGEEMAPLLATETTRKFFWDIGEGTHGNFGVARALHYFIEGRVGVGLAHPYMAWRKVDQGLPPMELYRLEGAFFLESLIQWMHQHRDLLSQDEKAEIVKVIGIGRQLEPPYNTVYYSARDDRTGLPIQAGIDYGSHQLDQAVGHRASVADFLIDFDRRLAMFLRIDSVERLDAFLADRRLTAELPLLTVPSLE